MKIRIKMTETVEYVRDYTTEELTELAAMPEGWSAMDDETILEYLENPNNTCLVDALWSDSHELSVTDRFLSSGIVED